MRERFECAYDAIVPLHELKPHPDNTNDHPRKQIELLSEIITYQGQRNAIVVSNRSGFITKGHGRLMALQELAWTNAAVDYQDYEDETQELADMQADNRISELAEQDEKKLQEIVLKKLPDDFDLKLLGSFDLKRIEIQTIPGCDEDETPALPIESACKRGDLFVLGDHRLLCGDATFIDDVERLMGGVKADMVFTDPPYGMFLNTNYDQMFKNDKSHRETGKRFDHVIGDHEDFTPELINTIFAAYNECPEIFLWGADYYMELIPDRPKGSWVVWDKRGSESMDRVVGNTFELCWSKSKHKRLVARIIWSGHHGMQSDDSKTRVHPTQKPSKLVEWFFENWGEKTKTVVDLFGGSGTTLIACEKTKRKCFMMEIDPHYCDVIINRFQKYSNKKAYLINQDGTQTAFDDLKGAES